MRIIHVEHHELQRGSGMFHIYHTDRGIFAEHFDQNGRSDWYMFDQRSRTYTRVRDPSMHAMLDNMVTGMHASQMQQHQAMSLPHPQMHPQMHPGFSHPSQYPQQHPH